QVRAGDERPARPDRRLPHPAARKRRDAVTVNEIEIPSDLEILMTREFEAPIELVFDVFTKEEHVRNAFPPFGEEMAVCDIDLRVGGAYHYVGVTDDGTEMSFRARFLEV